MGMAIIIWSKKFKIYKIQNLENKEITSNKIEIKDIKIRKINLK